MATSRSVMMPSTRPLSTTGSDPTPSFQRISVAAAKLVSALQNFTSFTITSRTFIVSFLLISSQGVGLLTYVFARGGPVLAELILRAILLQRTGERAPTRTH